MNKSFTCKYASQFFFKRKAKVQRMPYLPVSTNIVSSQTLTSYPRHVNNPQTQHPQPSHSNPGVVRCVSVSPIETLLMCNIYFLVTRSGAWQTPRRCHPCPPNEAPTPLMSIIKYKSAQLPDDVEIPDTLLMTDLISVPSYLLYHSVILCD